VSWQKKRPHGSEAVVGQVQEPAGAGGDQLARPLRLKSKPLYRKWKRLHRNWIPFLLITKGLACRVPLK
jgi:hypothetical protein